MVVLVTYLNKLYEPSRKQTYPRTIAYVTNTNSNNHTFSVPTPTPKVQEERPLSDFMGKQPLSVRANPGRDLSLPAHRFMPREGLRLQPIERLQGFSLTL